MRMSYDDSKDAFYGNFETLTENRDASADLLRLALTKPRFDKDAVDRIRQQLLASLVYAARDPEKVAAKEWYAVAFDGHTYARPVATAQKETLEGITQRGPRSDYRKRIFAKSNLKVVAVGDITADELGKLLDKVFGELPAQGRSRTCCQDIARLRRPRKADRNERAAGGRHVRAPRHGAQGPGLPDGLRVEPARRRRRLRLASDGRGAREARPRLFGLQLHAAVPARLDPVGRRRDAQRGDRRIPRRHQGRAEEDRRRGPDAERTRQRQELS